MIDIEVISEMIKDYLEKARFFSVSGDDSQARKTDKEKELIYGNFMVRGYVGLSSCKFLLACQVMKDFEWVNVDTTKKAFIAACAKFGDMEVLRKNITCLCADSADYCDVSRTHIIHCLNHNLEFAIKDSYSKIQEFEEIRSLYIFCSK